MNRTTLVHQVRSEPAKTVPLISQLSPSTNSENSENSKSCYLLLCNLSTRPTESISAGLTMKCTTKSGGKFTNWGFHELILICLKIIQSILFFFSVKNTFQDIYLSIHRLPVCLFLQEKKNSSRQKIEAWYNSSFQIITSWFKRSHQGQC